MENQISTIEVIEVNTPFPKKLKEKNIVILDVETEDQQIAVLGYYVVGSGKIKQLIFPSKVSPDFLKNTKFFKNTFLSGIKIACYNTSFEKKLFSLSQSKLIELQPYKYAAKERLISLETIDQISSKHLPVFNTKNFGIWSFHNYSCIIKEIVLYLGIGNFVKPNIKELYLQKVMANI